MASSPRQGPLLLLVLLALIAGVVIVARTALDGDPEAPEKLAEKSEQSFVGATQDPGGGPLESHVESAASAAIPEAEGRDPVALELLCLHHTELRPVAGIRLFRGEAPIAGPSTAKGILRIEPGPPGRLTIWGAGWTPVDVSGPPYPDRVLLTPAKATLEARLLNLESEQRVVRTLLQPHLVSLARTGPWQPELERVAEDRYQVLQLPPGTYDIYFWVARGTGPPRVFEALKVAVQAGKLTQTTLDIAAPSGSDEEADW